jgi:hypothetical protein
MDREIAFAEPLLSFKDWHVAVQCPKCREVRVVELVRLLRLYGPGCRFGDVFWRMRCGKCGSRPDWAKLDEGWVSGRAAYEIPLLP